MVSRLWKWGTLVPGLILLALAASGCARRTEEARPMQGRFEELFHEVREVVLQADSVAPSLSERSCYLAGDRIFVWDRAAHHVVAYDMSGARRMVLGGRSGSGPGELRFPYGVALDDSGNIYVNDCGNLRIDVFGSDGNYLESLPVENQLERILPFPTSEGFRLLVVGVAPFGGPDGRKYLARLLDRRGRVQRNLAPLEQPVVVYSWAVTCDPHERIYLANPLGDVVHVYDRLGREVRAIPLESPTVVRLRTKLNPEPSTMAEIRRQLRVLREERHTEVVGLRVVGDLLLVQYRLIGSEEPPKTYLLDAFSTEGHLLFYGITCPGYLCPRQGTDLVYFASCEHVESGADLLTLGGYRIGLGG